MPAVHKIATFRKSKSFGTVNVIYVLCHWFSCFCAFSKVTVNVLDVIVVRKLSPSKLLCLPPHLIDLMTNELFFIFPKLFSITFDPET